MADSFHRIGKNVGAEFRRGIARLWTSLRNALFLWILLFSGFGIFLVSYGYQSQTIEREATSYCHARYFLDAKYAFLDVAYPTAVMSDKLAPLSLQFDFLIRDTLPTITYTVDLRFYPPDVILVDNQGNPVTGTWKVTTSSLPQIFQVYLKDIALKDRPATVRPVLFVNGIQVQPGTFYACDTDITLKGTSEATWRKFLDLVLGPSTSLLGIAAVLIAAFVNLIQERQRKYESKREEIKRIYEELEAWKRELRSNPSEGAQRYQEFTKKKGVWQEREVQDRIREIWEDQDPRLQKVVEILERSADGNTDLKADAIEALRWAIVNLDERWRKKAMERLSKYDPSPLFYMLMRSERHGRFGEHFTDKVSIEERLALLTGQAESDGVTYFVKPECWNKLFGEDFLWIHGPSGYGRTAIASQLVQNSANRVMEEFCVYSSFDWSRAYRPLEVLLHSFARALLLYYVCYRSLFLRLETVQQFNLVQLWRWSFRDVEAALNMNGLVPYDEGAQIIEKVRQFSSGPWVALDVRDMIWRLSSLCPADYKRFMLLVDVQGERISDLDIPILLEPLNLVRNSGISLRVFTANASKALPLPLPWKSYQWTYTHGDLTNILNRYLDSERLESWCEPGAGVQGFNERLVDLVKTPRDIIRVLQELLRCKQEHPDQLLTQDNLEAILGPMNQWGSKHGT